MKKLIITAAVLLLALLVSSCVSPDTESTSSSPPASSEASSQTAEPTTIDVSAGKSAPCFSGLTAETKAVNVVQQGVEKSFNFEGVSLDKVLQKQNITAFSKIELDVSDSEDNVDITDAAKAEAGVFLAWSESGTDETPLRVFPKDAATANLLTRNVTAIIVTP